VLAGKKYGPKAEAKIFRIGLTIALGALAVALIVGLIWWVVAE
jgi:hypothetical protein